jgi:hypothetical protein
MKTLCLLPAALLLAALVPSPSAQQAAAPPAGPPVIDVDKIVLEYLSLPRGVDDDVLNTVATLFKRHVIVRNSDGSVRGPLLNLDSADDGLFVYDTAEYVKQVKDALARALSAVPREEQEPAAELRTEVWAPRFVSAEWLLIGLEPLRRPVRPEAAPGVSGDLKPNVTAQQVPALLVLRDTPAHVDRMLALLERIDQAPPQMLLSCWVVRAAGDEVDARLPAELADNLRRVLPYRGYSLLTTAMIRTSVMAGSEPSLTGAWAVPHEDGSEDHGEFELLLRPGGLDPEGRQLSIERIQFESSEGQRFDTSAVIGFDEYTVLGSTGSEPLLVVLQIRPLAH